MTDTTDDAQLVRLAQSGRLEAFEELVSRHERVLYTIALRITGNESDAQDVVQQSLLDAIEHLDGFRGESSFGTWIRRITTFAALKILRKRRGLPSVSLEASTEPEEGYDTVPHPEYIADWRNSPGDLVHARETSRLIQDALLTLDEAHRLVFILRDVEGFSVRETADQLGISEGNVKVRLLRARLQLREQLTRALGDPATRIFRGHHHH